MNIKNIFYFLVLTIIVLTACEKNKEKDDSESFYTIQLDTVLSGDYHKEASLEFDIDRDGKDDFQIYAWADGSPGMGYYPEIILKCLHDSAFVNINKFTDSIYVDIQQDTTNDNSGVAVHKITNYTCAKQSPDATFSKMKEYTIANFSNEIDNFLDGIWSNQTKLELGSLSTDGFWIDSSPNNDTTYYSS